MTIKKGQSYNTKIEKLVSPGWGKTRINNYVVFVPGTLPGDEIEFKLVKRQARHGTGKLLRLISPSPLRDKSPCNHYPDCGGCQFIDLDYAKQIELKTELLKDMVQDGLPEIADIVRPILQSEGNLYYRNKMEFAFGIEEQTIILGLKRRGRYDEVIPVKHCHLQSEKSNEILAFTSDFFNQNPLAVWDYEHNRGCLKHLIIRQSKTDDSYQLNIVLGHDSEDHVERYAQAIFDAFDCVSSVFKSIKETEGEFLNPILLKGKPVIEEDFSGIRFQISPQSFFQTNTLQAKKLYQTVADFADLNGSQSVLDLYCGTGTIGLFLSRQAKEIIGIEENEQAINDARKNANANTIRNATFFVGRVKNILKFQTFNPDLVVVDPPRCGMVPKALRRMLDLKAPNLIYVSCNPVTLFRDLKEVIAAGYKITMLQPVDMFPNTFHLECVVKAEYTG